MKYFEDDETLKDDESINNVEDVQENDEYDTTVEVIPPKDESVIPTNADSAQTEEEKEKIRKSIEKGEAIKDIEKGYKTRKGQFITGLVFFGLYILTFILMFVFQEAIVEILKTANLIKDPQNVVAYLFILILFLPLMISILAALLIPVLAFFLTSFILLITCRKSCVKGYRITSKICMWVDLAIFISTVAVLISWALS